MAPPIEEGCFERPLALLFASFQSHCLSILFDLKKSGVSSFSFSRRSPFFNRCVCPPPPPQKKTKFLYKFSPRFERTLPHPRSKLKTWRLRPLDHRGSTAPNTMLETTQVKVKKKSRIKSVCFLNRDLKVCLSAFQLSIHPFILFFFFHTIFQNIL